MIALHDYFHNVTPRKKKIREEGGEVKMRQQSNIFPLFFSTVQLGINPRTSCGRTGGTVRTSSSLHGTVLDLLLLLL